MISKNSFLLNFLILIILGHNCFASRTRIHDYVALENDDQKYETLKDIYGSLAISQSIIYCNSNKRVNDLYQAMQVDNFPACQIHSNMDKSERNQSYEDFKSGKHRVLISSNVTARGIDIQQVRGFD